MTLRTRLITAQAQRRRRAAGASVGPGIGRDHRPANGAPTGGFTDDSRRRDGSPAYGRTCAARWPSRCSASRPGPGGDQSESTARRELAALFGAAGGSFRARSSSVEPGHRWHWRDSTPVARNRQYQSLSGRAEFYTRITCCRHCRKISKPSPPRRSSPCPHRRTRGRDRIAPTTTESGAGILACHEATADANVCPTLKRHDFSPGR